MNIKQKISSNLNNLKGWKTKRKIVVIESDDWGSIRMASKDAYEYLLGKGFKVNECIFNKYDAIERNTDLERLFEVLDSVKDGAGNPAVLTANNIVANPDFDKIQASGFQEYFYEPFTQTLQHYKGRDRVADLYHKGIDSKVFKPQFHGREHVHVQNWLTDLRANDLHAVTAFEQRMFSASKGLTSNCKKEFLDAFGIYNSNQQEYVRSVIREGMALFNQLWGYQSTSCIAPCYIWSKAVEQFFHENDIRYIQSGRAQIAPKAGVEGYEVLRKYTGQENQYGQRYLVRNVYFEPSTAPENDWVDRAMTDIQSAFFWHTPAIINSHRVNYIGAINEDNSANGLRTLRNLLQSIVKRWPDVEFMSSDHLGSIMTTSIS